MVTHIANGEDKGTTFGMRSHHCWLFYKDHLGLPNADVSRLSSRSDSATLSTYISSPMDTFSNESRILKPDVRSA